MPLASHYAVADVKASIALSNQRDSEVAAKLAADKTAQEKRDSLLFYLNAASASEKVANITASSSKIDIAARFIANYTDRVLISKARTHIMATQLFSQIKQVKYAVALPAINALINVELGNAELLYQEGRSIEKA